MNKRRHRVLLLLLAGCMELCWIFAWVTFLSGAFLNKPFPLTEIVVPFYLAVALTVISKGRGWRVLTVLAIHVVGLLPGALGALHYFFSGTHPLLGLQWLKDLFGSNPDFIGWLSILFILFCSVFIYVRGTRLGAKPTDHPALCARFDLGIAAFFALFFIHFMIEAKGGVVMGGPVAQGMVVPFFLFSLLGIGLARNNGGGGEVICLRLPCPGTLLGFSLVVLAFGTGLVLLFLPYLTRAAEIGYVGLKAVSAPLGPILMGILQFLFRPKNFRNGNMGAPPTDTHPGGAGRGGRLGRTAHDGGCLGACDIACPCGPVGPDCVALVSLQVAYVQNLERTEGRMELGSAPGLAQEEAGFSCFHGEGRGPGA